MINMYEIRVDGTFIYAKVEIIDGKPVRDWFNIVVDGEKQRIVEHTHDRDDSYVGHALFRLIKLFNLHKRGKSIPTKVTVAWY